jgi:VanZ family protein
MEISDSLLHFAPYFLLALLPALRERRTTATLLACALPFMGMLLEFAQQLVGRSFGLNDIVANTAGVVCGWGVGLRLSAQRPLQQPVPFASSRDRR